MRNRAIWSVGLLLVASTTDNGSASDTDPPAKWVSNSVGMKLVLISPGEFVMGSAEAEKYGTHDEKQHRVRITKPYCLAVHEVTQEQYEKIMGEQPWSGRAYVEEGAEYPATYVRWEEAVEFCKKLSSKEGRRYRLPTEAEWEYACRAGSTSLYCYGDDGADLRTYAWYSVNSYDGVERYPRQVGSKRANSWGLFDMHGNVWEWCQDWYGEDYYESSPTEDPTGPKSGSLRVFRSGSGDCGSWGCRSAARTALKPDDRGDFLGFRVALVLEE